MSALLWNKALYKNILYFVWEDQRDSMYCIFYTVLIICIWFIQNSYALNWANTAHLGKYSTVCSGELFEECYVNTSVNNTSKSLKSAKLILWIHSTTRSRLYKHLLIVCSWRIKHNWSHARHCKSLKIKPPKMFLQLEIEYMNIYL